MPLRWQDLCYRTSLLDHFKSESEFIHNRTGPFDLYFDNFPERNCLFTSEHANVISK